MESNRLSLEQLPALVAELTWKVDNLTYILKTLQEQKKSIIPDEEKPLSVVEAAKFLGIAKQTVYQNIDRIPHVKRFGRLYFFRSKLAEYLNAGEGVTL